jgi:hypothetical protein
MAMKTCYDWPYIGQVAIIFILLDAVCGVFFALINKNPYIIQKCIKQLYRPLSRLPQAEGWERVGINTVQLGTSDLYSTGYV